jgi:hypothetical protein
LGEVDKVEGGGGRGGERKGRRGGDEDAVEKLGGAALGTGETEKT